MGSGESKEVETETPLETVRSRNLNLFEQKPNVQHTLRKESVITPVISTKQEYHNIARSSTISPDAESKSLTKSYETQYNKSSICNVTDTDAGNTHDTQTKTISWNDTNIPTIRGSYGQFRGVNRLNSRHVQRKRDNDEKRSICNVTDTDAVNSHHTQTKTISWNDPNIPTIRGFRKKFVRPYGRSRGGNRLHSGYVQRRKDNDEKRTNQEQKKVYDCFIDDTIKSQISSMLNSIHVLEYDLSKISDSKEQVEINNEPPKKYEPQPEEIYEEKHFDSSNVYRNQLMNKYEFDEPSALRFLISYGFEKEHCLEALIHSNGDEELSLYLLYISYFNDGLSVREFNKPPMYNSKNLLSLRQAEMNMLKARYKSFFAEKGNLWTFKLKVDHLVNNFKDKSIKTNTDEKIFVLDIFLSAKYPFVPPLVLLKPNRFLEPHVNFQISKRLFESARFSGSHRPVIQVLNLLENIRAIKDILETGGNFIYPDQFKFNQKKTHFDSESEGEITRLAKQDRMIVYECRQRMASSHYKKIRKILPAWKYKEEILNSIRHNQIIILKGETGCGKSTQVPQFIFDEWIDTFHGQHLEIVCTQPRRLSALGVATRVCAERAEKVGYSVGYQVRFNHCISENTRLTFCTMGILLKRIQREPTLGNITHVIVDEVHERSAESDFLLLILRNVLKIRTDLKVVLMSATVDTLMLSEYFVGVPIIEIPGKTYPVRQIFLEEILEITRYTVRMDSECFRTPTFHNNVDDTIPIDEKEDQCLTLAELRLRYNDCNEKTCQTISNSNEDKIDFELILEALNWIITQKKHSEIGTILIFLPGYAEISSMMMLLKENRIFRDRKKYRILPLHSSVTTEEQSLIFQKPVINQSKIILSTNIAETSVTIEDCVFVIDSGKMKQKRFDPEKNVECLETIWVSKANALQRKGRAGRVKPGVCIHLYTKHRFEHNFISHPVPEIKRIPLDNLVLNMKVVINYDYHSIREAFDDFIEPPPKENLRRTIMNLRDDQVIDDEENLTPLGYNLAALPLNVKPGKLLLYGVVFNCVDATLTMAAYLSHKSPFAPPFDKKKEFTEKKKLLSVANSDPITIFRVYRTSVKLETENRQKAQEFMDEHFICPKIINELKQIKYQLLQCLISLGFIILDTPLNTKAKHDDIYKTTGLKYNQNEENIDLVKSIICAAFYPNIAKKIERQYFSLNSCEPLSGSMGEVPSSSQEKVLVDPNSVNFGITCFSSDQFVFHEKERRRNKLIFLDSTMISVKSLFLFSNCDFSINSYESIILLEQNNTRLDTGTSQIAELMASLRKELQYLCKEIWKHPALGLQYQEKGKKIIQAILKLIKQ